MAAPTAVTSVVWGRVTGTPHWSAWICKQEVHDGGPTVGVKLEHGLTSGADHRLHDVAALKSHRFDSRTGEVCPPGSLREADDGATRLGIPPGTSEAGKGRDQVHAVVARNLGGERPDLGCRADQAETVSQPLDRRAGRENGAFEGVAEAVFGAGGAWSPRSQATVVKSPSVGGGRWAPRFMSTKLPVP